jgi:PhoPQ-activated pathogenicity-related protein
MEKLAQKIRRVSNRKIPVVAVIFISLVAMVAGAFAATIVVDTTNFKFTGEAGTYHTSSGAFIIVDNGLTVAMNSFSDNTTNPIPLAGTNWQVQNAITPGHWVDSVSFHMPSPNASNAGPHTATIKIQNDGTGTVAGTTIVNPTFAAWTTSATTSTGTVTVYLDTGQTTITSPLTIYVSIN